MVAIPVAFHSFNINANQILTYIGSIIGGVATFIGVLLTIDYQNKENARTQELLDARHSEQMRLNNYPILRYDLRKDHNNLIATHINMDNSFEDIECTKYDVKFTAENIGKNPCLNLEVRYSIDGEEYLSLASVIENPLVLPDEKREVAMVIQLPNLNFFDQKSQAKPKYSMKFQCKYKDILENEYCQIVNIKIPQMMIYYDDEPVSYEYSFIVDNIESNFQLGSDLIG